LIKPFKRSGFPSYKNVKSVRQTPRVAQKLVGRRKLGKNWEKFHFPTNFSATYLCKEHREGLECGYDP